MSTKHLSKFSLKRFGRLFLILSLVFGGLFAMFLWLVIQDEQPMFFPLDNASGEYRVTQGCLQGSGWVDESQYEGEWYCVEYRGEDVFMADQYEGDQSFRIKVGRSEVDLVPYLDKRVTNLQGKFSSSSHQCILDDCVDIGGPWAVLDITSLELAE